MMLITLPLFMPFAAQYGFDTVWLGLILLLAFEVGLSTPPFGLLLYVVIESAQGDMSLKTVAFAAAPYVALTLVLIVLVVVFPQLALLLPSLI